VYATAYCGRHKIAGECSTFTEVWRRHISGEMESFDTAGLAYMKRFLGNLMQKNLNPFTSSWNINSPVFYSRCTYPVDGLWEFRSHIWCGKTGVMALGLEQKYAWNYPGK